VSNSEPLLRVEGLAAGWNGLPVLRGVTFSLGRREMLSLLGPNGSGKTTLLRCLVGLEAISSGSVVLEGVEITHRPPHLRHIGLMSQEPALFPGRSVIENIAYAPLLRGRDERAAREEVGRILELLHLEGFEDRRSDQLSGGERQRVALARTLAARPSVVLLDEPFASIDVELRAVLRAEFRRVLRELGTAAIHVTHDREDGLFLGDRVGLLFDGVLETVGPPQEVFDHPPSARAARLLGYNVLRDGIGWSAVHPSDLRVGGEAPTAREGTAWAIGRAGRETLIVVSFDDGTRVELRTPDPPPGLEPGGRVRVSWSRSVPLPASPGEPPE